MYTWGGVTLSKVSVYTALSCREMVMGFAVARACARQRGQNGHAATVPSLTGYFGCSVISSFERCTGWAGTPGFRVFSCACSVAA